jgi:thiosulfate reductase cytochrome b subunit
MNLSVHLFAASYAAQIVVAIIAFFVVSRVDIPKPVVGKGTGGRPLGEIIAQPKFIAAALCGVTSYALMNLIMTSAPLAMRMCGHSLTDSNNAIQWHVLAMYGPSFFTGNLINRFGTSRVIAAGLLLLAAAAVVDIAGITVWHFWIGLILLGVGWNFGFIGASAMVTQCHRPEERNKVQSFNDFLIFGMMAIGSFSSGQMLATLGWNSVNLVVFPPLILAGVALVWLSVKTRQGSATA